MNYRLTPQDKDTAGISPVVHYVQYYAVIVLNNNKVIFYLTRTVIFIWKIS